MNYRLIGFSLLVLTLFVPQFASAQDYFDSSWYRTPTITPTSSPEIIFPVEGVAVFSDDFGDGRSGGRLHEGNDLMAPKMTPILAARGGRVSSAPTTEPSYGWMIVIAGDDGYEYNYLHINNDTPGTDDGNGGLLYAYAPDIVRDAQVIQGQQIAWVGDSGNAESTGSHLHFEIRLPDGTAINPYPYLNAALALNNFNIAAVKASSPTINIDKNLVSSTSTVHCLAGSLIRTPLISSVYYCGLDGKRYVFPNVQVYNSWYADFANVLTISPEEMSKISLGGNVTYRPGVKLVKITTDPRVYAVDHGGVLRGLITPAIATKYYGTSWAKNVEDIPDAFFMNYKMGLSIDN